MSELQRRLLKDLLMPVVKAPVSLRPVFVRMLVDHQASTVPEAVSVLWIVTEITLLNALCWRRKMLQTYFWRQRTLKIFDPPSLFSYFILKII